MECHELEEKYTESQSALSRAISERKKFEADAVAASDELHEAKFELKNAEEKVCMIKKKSKKIIYNNLIKFKIRTINSALLKREEEIRHDRELIADIETSRKALDAQLKETQVKLEQVDEVARREARRLNAKLETKVYIYKI